MSEKQTGEKSFIFNIQNKIGGILWKLEKILLQTVPAVHLY